MKKVTKFLSLMVAAALTVTGFHVTDQSIGSVKAKGENYLDPIKLQYNVGYQELNHAGNNHPWYVLDIPEDGDLKITILGNGVQLEKLYAGVENIGTFSWVDAYKNIDANQPYVAHFTTAAGSYYFQINHSRSDSFKMKIEFSGYGTKEQTPDSYENPTGYVPGSEINGVVSYTDVYDWYKFNINENGKYKISYMANPGSYEVELLDSDLRNEWHISNVYNTEPKVDIKYLTAGTYYLKVRGWNHAKYRISINKQSIAATTIKKVKSNKKKTAEVKLKYVSGVDGYQIRYSTNKNFKGKVKTKSFEYTSYSNPKYIVATLKKLKRHKNYYVQVRTFEKGISGNYYYSDWSKTKKVKVK